MEVFSPWAWAGFILLISFMLALDLGVFRKGSHSVSMREALLWCAVWFSLAMGFNGFVLWNSGREAAMEWFTSYIVEICLSVDNLFVFILIFTYFKVAEQHQHRVLFWGILGAAVMRAVFILAGVELISHFAWIIYLFGAFLVFTGIKLALPKKEEESFDPEKNVAVQAVRKVFPLSTQGDPGHFFHCVDGRRHITPLFLVLVVVETTDLAFAVDSIPAVLAITKSSFIAFTSNIFAILGLRSLYFALRGVMGLFRFLNLGLALVLTFIGAKMLIGHWVHVSTGVSLGVIGGVLSMAVLASLLLPEKKHP
ncbi:TerC family protein [Nibricoccus sp. IMCC34717]|uniref:TerC family protein n=1 Tax=Nibricoccus sp. IMCC34717 TaxID=3034021 RepID=UPI00384C083B